MWDDLSMREKAAFMKVALKNDIIRLEEIKDRYNKFEEGGDLRNKQIQDINDWALNNPNRVFGDDFREQRQYLTEDTWNTLYPQLDLKIGDSNWNKIPSYLQDRLNRESINRAQNKAGEFIYNTAKGASSIMLPSSGPIIAGAEVLASQMIPNTSKDIKRDALINASLEMVPYGILGTYKIGKTIRNISNPTFRQRHAYAAIAPFSYEDAKRRGIKWIKNMINDTPISIENPSWKDKAEEFSKIMAFNADINPRIVYETRTDAWRIYNHLPQKFNSYIKNIDGSYSYDLNKIDKLNREIGMATHIKPFQKYDYLTTSGGGLTGKYNITLGKNNSKKYKYNYIEDVWDLNPFSRENNKISDVLPMIKKPFILSNKMRNTVGNTLQNIGSNIRINRKEYEKALKDASGELEFEILSPDIFEYNSKFRRGLGNAVEKLGSKVKSKTPIYLNPTLRKIDKIGTEFEVGQITGGKSFLMKTKIPYTEEIIRDLGEPELEYTLGFKGADKNFKFPEISRDNNYNFLNTSNFENKYNKFDAGGFIMNQNNTPLVYTDVNNNLAFKNLINYSKDYNKPFYKQRTKEVSDFADIIENWNINRNIGRADFKREVASNPEDVVYYYKDKYPTLYNRMMKNPSRRNIKNLYTTGTGQFKNMVTNKQSDPDIGDEIWNALNEYNLTYAQKMALMANSYHESQGWKHNKQYSGPAKGYYMMEKPQRRKYEKWLKDNKLSNSAANETRYILSLFASRDKSLETSWDRAKDSQELIRTFKSPEEAKAHDLRSAYQHMGYTTEQAYEDWNSGDVNLAIKAFEGLFERAGIPALENRYRIGEVLNYLYK